MKDVQATHGMKLQLGRCGENHATCVWFDVGEWQREYGEGTVHLLHQRNGDIAPYPCQITVDGSMVSWVVTNADVAVAGRGRAELQYHVGDSCVKSDIYATNTTRSMSDAGPVPPEPEEGWVQQVLDAAERAENAAMHPPEPRDGTWWLWDEEIGDYVDSGEYAKGDDAYAKAQEYGYEGSEDEFYLSMVDSTETQVHAATHAANGSDPITPAMIGAATAGHKHTATEVGAAPADHTHTAEEIGAAPAYTYGTEDIEAGSASPYATGHLHFVYE